MGAWHNPKQVSFQPSNAVIRNAGAIGQSISDEMNGLFLRQMKRREDELNYEKFGYKKKRDVVDDTQWAYNASQKNEEISNNTNRISNAKSYHDGMLKHHNTTDTLNQRKYKNMLAIQKDVKNASIAKGKILTEKNPFLRDLFASKTLKEPAPANEYIARISGIKPNEPTFDYNVTDDDYRSIGVSGYGGVSTSDASTTSLREFKAYNKSREGQNLPLIPYSKFYEDNQLKKSLGKGGNDLNNLTARREKIAKEMGIQPHKLADININNLPDDIKYKLNNYAMASDQLAQSKMPDKMKEKMMQYGRLSDSASMVGKYMKSNDTGALDRIYNVANSYLGFGNIDELARKSMTESAYMDYKNTMLKIVSGAAVPKDEATRFEMAFGKLLNTDTVVREKIGTQIRLTLSELRTAKTQYDPVAFNIRYGGIVRTLEKAESLLTRVGSQNSKVTRVDQQPIKHENGRIVVKMSDGSKRYE